MPSETAKQYPDAPDIAEEGELTMEELKEAFRFCSHKNKTKQYYKVFLFEDCLMIVGKDSYPSPDLEKY